MASPGLSQVYLLLTSSWKSPIRASLYFRTHRLPIKGERIAIQLVEGEFHGPPGRIANAVGGAFDATSAVFIEERVRVLHEKPEPDRTHFMFELGLHVENDRVL